MSNESIAFFSSSVREMYFDIKSNSMSCIFLYVVITFVTLATNEQGFVQAWDLKNVCPEPLLIEKQMYKITYKSPIDIRPELKLIANYSRS